MQKLYYLFIQIWDSIMSKKAAEEPTLLNQFVLLTFAVGVSLLIITVTIAMIGKEFRLTS